MGSSTGVSRRARYWTVLFGLLSLLVLALVFGRTAREQYYIWRLGSEDLAVSQRAATILGNMGSSRAFPYIIVIDNAVVSHKISLSGMSGGRPGYSHPEGYGPRAKEILGPYISSLTEIVRNRAEADLSHVRQGLGDEKPHLRALHAYLAGEARERGKPLVPTLASLLKDDSRA